MNGAYLALVWILMNGIWPVGLCCNYSPLSTLHWKTRWWLRRCISYFRPRQHLLSMYFATFASHQCNQGLQLLFGRHWCRPVFLHSEDIDVDPFFSTARARDRAGAAMCMRSTPGCGTLAGPSACWWTFGRQNRKDPQAFQARNFPARLEDPAGPEACSRRGRFQPELKWYDIHKPVI